MTIRGTPSIGKRNRCPSCPNALQIASGQASGAERQASLSYRRTDARRANSMLAATFAVGSCKPSLPSYGSISAAVSSVPSGSTVEVCPGTYAEQVFITQSLTLKGIASGNTSDVIITVPVSGLTVISDVFGDQIAAPVAVTAGSVNISNLTVDGTGNGVTSPTWLTGIYYGDGSSGIVSEVTVRNLSAFGRGIGAWIVGLGGESITVENSSFHDIDNASVLPAGSFSPTVKGNTMEANFIQVQWLGGPGSLTGNVMNSGQIGVFTDSPGTVSGNTITKATSYGIWMPFGPGSFNVTSNKISNVPTGIYLTEGGDTYKANSITKVGIAIECNCFVPTVVSNTINDAGTGLDNVPASFSGANAFNNVGTIRTGGCAAARSKGAPDVPGRHLPIPVHVN